jgi:hypothetical protein
MPSRITDRHVPLKSQLRKLNLTEYPHCPGFEPAHKYLFLVNCLAFSSNCPSTSTNCPRPKKKQRLEIDIMPYQTGEVESAVAKTKEDILTPKKA